MTDHPMTPQSGSNVHGLDEGPGRPREDRTATERRIHPVSEARLKAQLGFVCRCTETARCEISSVGPTWCISHLEV